MRTFSVFMIALLATTAGAATKRLPTDIKLPTQQMVEKQSFNNVVAANQSTILNDTSGPISAGSSTVSVFTAQPDVARNITITPSNNTAVEACSVTVTGKNIHGATISESLSIADNQTVPTVGTSAFKTLTSILFPAACEQSGYGATWDVGTTTALGLKGCLNAAGHIFHATVDGARESTNPTMAVNASVVSSNTATFNTAPDGSRDFELFYMQNYRCNPN